MLSQSHGRRCLVLALCVGVLFLVVKLQYHDPSYTTSGTFDILRQYSSSKTIARGIGNDTLGFEKIFVINAPWRTDRKDEISLAASYSGISLAFVDGVDADQIHENAYPPGGAHRGLSKGLKGSWRAHMNALREVIQQDLATALIMEDDVDWDFRIRSQLSGISPGVRRVPELVLQSERQKTEHIPSSDEKLSDVELAKRSSLYATSLPDGAEVNDEPYGRDWDVLWLGHCGARLPPPSPHSPNRIVVANDRTVPEPQYLKPMSNAPLDAMGSLYPPHSRVIHQSNATLCTIAYGVTQAGARKLLYEFGIREFSKGYDFALSDYCNGQTRAQKEGSAPLPRCLTVQPPVFGHHFGERPGSDITSVGPGGKPERESRYLKWSVRMNLERLVKGEEGIVEQWPDTDWVR